VLVVDDEGEDRRWLEETLVKSGYLVTSAATGREALEQLRKRKYAAITVDLILPDLSGWDLIRSIRADSLNKDTPILMVTVVADKSAGIAVPIHDYLVKPLEPDHLRMSLAEAGVVPHTDQTVLVVDDDVTTFKLLEPVVREWGYKPIFAQSGASALKMLEGTNPSALVVDLVMPEMTGLQFLNRIRTEKRYRDTPVIVMTAKDLSAEEIRELEGLADSIVRKGAGSSLDLLEALHDCAPVPAGIQQVA
jgi:CheY-like chemotaxis protein